MAGDGRSLGAISEAHRRWDLWRVCHWRIQNCRSSRAYIRTAMRWTSLDVSVIAAGAWSWPMWTWLRSYSSTCLETEARDGCVRSVV